MSLYLYLAAGAVLLLSGSYTGWHERALREPAMINGQKNADIAACTEVQAKTKGENDALTKDRDRIAADAARYKLQHPNQCYILTNDGKLQPSGNQHAGMHGISSNWLRDYAALCETYRSELIVCTGQKDLNAQ